MPNFVALDYPTLGTPHHPPFTSPCMTSAHLILASPSLHYTYSSPFTSHALCIGNNMGLVDKDQHRYASLLSIQLGVAPWKAKPAAISFCFVELSCVAYYRQSNIRSIFNKSWLSCWNVHFLGLCHQYIQKIPSQLPGASYTPGWHQRLLHAGLASVEAYSQSWPPGNLSSSWQGLLTIPKFFLARLTHNPGLQET